MAETEGIAAVTPSASMDRRTLGANRRFLNRPTGPSLCQAESAQGPWPTHPDGAPLSGVAADSPRARPRPLCRLSGSALLVSGKTRLSVGSRMRPAAIRMGQMAYCQRLARERRSPGARGAPVPKYDGCGTGRRRTHAIGTGGSAGVAAGHVLGLPPRRTEAIQVTQVGPGGPSDPTRLTPGPINLVAVDPELNTLARGVSGPARRKNARAARVCGSA
jgi:hypothetical protein